MSNVNSPFGLRAVRHMTGGCVRTNEYSIASAYNTSIKKGDIVQMTGTGKNIAISAAGNADNIGVFQGCHYVDSTGSQQWSNQWPANQVATEIVANIYDDPNIVYEVQCDTLAEGDIGALVDINVGTGSTVTGISGLYADVGAGTDTANDNLRLLELKKSPDNAYGAYAKAFVCFAEHVLGRVVAGVGGI